MALCSHSNRTEAVYPNTIHQDQSASFMLEQFAGNAGRSNPQPAERRLVASRRDGTWWAFLYGNFRPRRRTSRRAADQHYVLFDWHEPRVLFLTLGVLLLSCTDALFTLNLLTIGASEANPVMASMLERGVESFVAAKIMITSFCLVILAVAARRKFLGSFSGEHLLQIFCALYFLVICYELYLFIYVFELNLLLVL